MQVEKADAEHWLRANLTEAFNLPSLAVAWLLDLWTAAQAFDDVADGDEVDRADLDRTLWFSMAGCQQNPFYAANVTMLQPVLALAVLKWKASDVAERAGKADARSFVWRAAFYDVILMTVLICHGPSVAMASAINVMNLYGESYADYLAEFNHA